MLDASPFSVVQYFCTSYINIKKKKLWVMYNVQLEISTIIYRMVKGVPSRKLTNIRFTNVLIVSNVFNTFYNSYIKSGFMQPPLNTVFKKMKTSMQCPQKSISK